MGNHAMYLRDMMQKPRETLNAARENLDKIEFDAIVCCGVSGLLLAPTLALYMDKHLAVVRKVSDSNHSEFNVESNMEDGDSWIFVDDLTATGNTQSYVRERMAKLGHGNTVGAYLYTEQMFHRYRGGANAYVPPCAGY